MMRYIYMATGIYALVLFILLYLAILGVKYLGL